MKAKTTKPAAQPAADQPATQVATSAPVPTPEAAKAVKAPVAKGTGTKGASAKTAGKSAPASGAGNKKSTAAKTVKTKAKKPKLVRDSFTMPDNEYAMLADIKHACLQAGFEVKKSQLLRIGVSMVNALDTASLRKRLNTLAPLKPGRPKSA
jgi:hypothetical protein